jgi:pimeloyl-ACP methyl ester carboxylesterase
MKKDMPNVALPKPSLINMLGEGRTFFELGVSSMMMPLLLQAPRGDSHPVIVLPGFMAGDISTKPLRTFLAAKGYQTYGWGLGRNLGTEIVGGDNLLSEALLTRIMDISAKHNQKVSIVGWSLGGILAREIARLMPDIVRQVITLGSPFNGPSGSVTMVAKLFGMINGEIVTNNPNAMQTMLKPPPVPSTAIFSKTDGIAHWKACINHNLDINDEAENIEVSGSHTGLGHNYQVLWIVAERLAQKEGEWQAYKRNKSAKSIASEKQVMSTNHA